jgi:hypothetical protein
MVLSLGQIFREKAANVDAGEEFTVTCSYLEVYNEVGSGRSSSNSNSSGSSSSSNSCSSCGRGDPEIVVQQSSQEVSHAVWIMGKGGGQEAQQQSSAVKEVYLDWSRGNDMSQTQCVAG